MTKEMFESITDWQRRVFTQATSLSAANHLTEEVEELKEDLILGSPKVASEYADCFMLLFGSASLYGLSYEDICKAINDKMEINIRRKWGSVNEKGYVKHESSSPNIKVEEEKNAEEILAKHFVEKGLSKGMYGIFDKHNLCKVLAAMEEYKNLSAPALNVEEAAEAFKWNDELVIKFGLKLINQGWSVNDINDFKEWQSQQSYPK